MLANSPMTKRYGEKAEEWAIHDHEGFGSLQIGEYTGIERISRLAKGIEEHGTAFGINIMDLPANADGYPEHDHAHDGQEEIYVTLSGGGVMQIEGDEVALDANTIIRVAAGTKRKVLPGDEGARLLVVGGTPGKAYEPN